MFLDIDDVEIGETSSKRNAGRGDARTRADRATMARPRGAAEPAADLRSRPRAQALKQKWGVRYLVLLGTDDHRGAESVEPTLDLFCGEEAAGVPRVPAVPRATQA
jgi:hypothetical protein